MNRRRLLLAAGVVVLPPVVDAERPGGGLGDPHATALVGLRPHSGADRPQAQKR